MASSSSTSGNVVTFSSEILNQIFGSEFTTKFIIEQEQFSHHYSAEPSSTTDGLSKSAPVSTNNAASSKSKAKSQLPISNNTATSSRRPTISNNITGKKSAKSYSKSKPSVNSADKASGSTVPSATSSEPTPATDIQFPAQILSNQINSRLDALIASNPNVLSHESLEGRLGPKIVKFDFSTHVGSFIMSSDRLGLSSQSNFASVRANNCVYKGKWQYEVQLSTCGVMQIGWATINTKFTAEKGVGDSPDSYSYDGNRLRKWNAAPTVYGKEVWKGGDIISCCIDLDDASIEFFRNGISLGKAFTDIHHGPGIAYFPAVSLTYNEGLVANFGASPFLFPINGYEPIQSPKIIEDTKSILLLSWLDKILTIYPKYLSNVKVGTSTAPANINNSASMNLITNLLFEHLEPNIGSAYVTEHTLLPFLAKLHGLPSNVMDYDQREFHHEPTGKLHLCLDLMWTYLEETVIKNILERFAIILMNYVKSNTFSFSYPYQTYSIQLLIGLLEHRRTRRHFIHHLLFDKTKITNFLYVRPIDEDVMKTIISTSWWDGKTPVNAPEAVAYERGCNFIHEKISQLENLQINLLNVCLINTDGTETRPSSRSLFLRMLRNYISDTLKHRSIVVHPISKPMCTFFRILKTISNLWANEIEKKSSTTTTLTLPDLPATMFYDTTIDYFDLERAGGLSNHLYKIYHIEVAEALGIPDYYTPRDPPPLNRQERLIRHHMILQGFESLESSLNSTEDNETVTTGTAEGAGAGAGPSSHATTRQPPQTHRDTPFPSIFHLLSTHPVQPHHDVGPDGNAHSASAPLIRVTNATPNVVGGESSISRATTETRATGTSHEPSLAPPISQVPSLINIAEITPHPLNNTGTQEPQHQHRHEISTQIASPTQFVGLLPNLLFGHPGGVGGGVAPSSTPFTPLMNQPGGASNASNADSASMESDTSSTSSIDETSINENNFGGPTQIVAETPSGHNMVIPMFAEFRNFFRPDLALTFFPGNIFGFGGLGHQVRPVNPHLAELNRNNGIMDSRTSLRELLDDTILIYSVSVSHHVEKVVELRKNIEEYITALNEATKTLKTNEQKLTASQKLELNKSIEIFTNKLNEQSRHIAWLKSAVFTVERQNLIVAFLKTLIASLKSSSAIGLLFKFTPDVYFTVLVQLTNLLLTQMPPTVSYQQIHGFQNLFRDVAEFIALHFNDPRIVLSETKDTLTQALSKFVTDRTMLTALEQMLDSSKTQMITSLLKPYENRAWAQNNWMLVRLWQGNGFGFQYLNCASARKSFHTGSQDEYGISINLPPTPSPILQAYVKNILLSNQELAVSFLHSVLNQLNWSFSEFIGLLQEVNSAAAQAEHINFDSRQMKVCVTCFELTQALLRVVEMVASVATPVLTDFSRDGAQALLERLCMLLSQVLNRIGCSSGAFGQVLNLQIPGLETLTFYALLSSVAGVLVALLHDEVKITDKAKLPVTKAIILEPSMQINNLNFLLGNSEQQQALAARDHTTTTSSIFSLRNYVPEDINPSELRSLEATIAHINKWSQKFEADTESISDDDICTICYAYKKSATFLPCHHSTCRACIVHHLLNRGECFFCKGVIEKVIASDGTVIHDIHGSKEPHHVDFENVTTDIQEPANTNNHSGATNDHPPGRPGPSSHH